MWEIEQVSENEDNSRPIKKKPKPNEIRIEPCGEYKTIELEHRNSEKITRIGAQMNPILELMMVNF